ncbi:MAG: hypothetical protein ACLFR7_10665 [Opitutales bacterium]
MVGPFQRSVAWLALGLAVVGDAGAQRPAEALPQRSLALRFYTHGTSSLRDLYIFTQKGERQPLRLIPGSMTGRYVYRGPGRVQLYREERGSDGELYDVPMAAVEVPAGMDEVLVLVVNQGTDRGPLHLFATDDGAAALPLNHLAFLNLTGAPLEGLVGEQPVRLGPGRSAALPMESYFGQPSVLLGLAVRHEGEARIVLESRERYYPGRRTLIVLLPPSEAGSLQIVAFRLQELAPKVEATEERRE